MPSLQRKRLPTKRQLKGKKPGAAWRNRLAHSVMSSTDKSRRPSLPYGKANFNSNNLGGSWHKPRAAFFYAYCVTKFDHNMEIKIAKERVLKTFLYQKFLNVRKSRDSYPLWQRSQVYSEFSPQSNFSDVFRVLLTLFLMFFDFFCWCFCLSRKRNFHSMRHRRHMMRI